MPRIDDGLDGLLTLAGGMIELLGWLFEIVVGLPEFLEGVFAVMRKGWERGVAAAAAIGAFALVIRNRLNALRRGRTEEDGARPGLLTRFRARTGMMTGRSSIRRIHARLHIRQFSAGRRKSVPLVEPV